MVRHTWFDIVPDGSGTGSATITARTNDLRLGVDGPTPWRSVDLRVQLNPDATIRTIEIDPFMPAVTRMLVGRPSGRGLRATLKREPWPTPVERIVRRMLWDLPIVSSLFHQTELLDHPGARGPRPLQLAGVDQCSGWRDAGEMLQYTAAHDGLLTMPLTDTVGTDSLADMWVGGLDPLPPMATRRFRSTMVIDQPDGGPIRLAHRDSYADPDGVERRLHEWTVDTSLDETGRFGEVVTRAGQLPWVECPFAGDSAGRLRGVTPGEVDDLITSDFRGISTCTHLNDTLRLLADLGDLSP